MSLKAVVAYVTLVLGASMAAAQTPNAPRELAFPTRDLTFETRGLTFETRGLTFEVLDLDFRVENMGGQTAVPA